MARCAVPARVQRAGRTRDDTRITAAIAVSRCTWNGEFRFAGTGRAVL
jgi:hypothetical protein